MRIDAHVHCDPEEGFVDRLLEEERRLGFDKVVLNGALWTPGPEDANDSVEQAMKKYPKEIIGFAYLPLGRKGPEAVREFHSRGFKGLKFIRPMVPYADKSLYPVYEAAEELGMVCLFHLGIVVRTLHDREFDVNNERHRPVYLDTLARHFPKLKLVGAHFGNPWYEEAAMICRWNPNLYFDLSGSSLKAKPPSFFSQLLWWTETSQYKDPEGRHAWAKMVFGSDVAINMIEDVMNDFSRTMDEIGLRKDLQEAVFGNTMAKVLGLD